MTAAPVSTPLAQQPVPDNPIRLPEGHLACAGCGVAVPVDSPGIEVVQAVVLGREWSMPKEVELAVCRVCRALRRRALALVRQNPRLARRIGTRRSLPTGCCPRCTAWRSCTVPTSC